MDKFKHEKNGGQWPPFFKPPTWPTFPFDVLTAHGVTSPRHCSDCVERWEGGNHEVTQGRRALLLRHSRIYFHQKKVFATPSL